MPTAVRTFLTTAEVADRYRTSPSTIRYWRHMSTGPTGITVGRRTLYAVEELERWERERETAAGHGSAA